MPRSYNHLGAVIRAVPDISSELVEKAITDIAASAGATAPIDTGALAASYFAEMRSQFEGIAGSNMEYAPYVEYGTIHTSAQPHLVPASDRIIVAVNEYRNRIEDVARRG